MVAIKKPSLANHINLALLNLQVISEVKDYKWIESEKKNYDIGWNQALTEWVEQYYDEWLTENITRFLKDLEQ